MAEASRLERESCGFESLPNHCVYDTSQHGIRACEAWIDGCNSRYTPWLYSIMAIICGFEPYDVGPIPTGASYSFEGSRASPAHRNLLCYIHLRLF